MLGATASAQSFGGTFDGATLGFSHVSSSSAGAFIYSQTRVLGSAQVSFGNFAVQGDASFFGYDSDPWDQATLLVHGMFRFSPGLVAGAYYGREFWNGGATTYTDFGLEAKFTPTVLDGKLTVEGFVGAFQQDFTGTKNRMIGFGATYAVNDQVSLGVSYLRGAWDQLNVPADRYDVLELEGTYTFASGLFATGSFTQTYFRALIMKIPQASPSASTLATLPHFKGVPMPISTPATDPDCMRHRKLAKTT